MADIFVLFGSCVFAFFGLLMIWLAFSFFTKKKRMEKWIKTKATISSSQLKSTTSGTGSDRSTMYKPVVSYSYNFGGKTYLGTENEFGSSNRSEVENLLSKYSEGAEVEILVDPQHPEKSGIFELSTQSNLLIFVLIGFGAVFCAMGLIIYIIFGSDNIGIFDQNSNSVSSKPGVFDFAINLLGLLFAFSVGAIFTYIGYYLLKKDQAIIQSWKLAEAEVVSASIATKTESRKYDNGVRYDQTMYSPLIRYQYSYGAKKYSGEDSSYYTSSQSEADLAVSQKPEGSKISIYVNPSNPSESAMKDRGTSRDMFAYIFIAVGILAMLMGIAIGILSFF